MNNWTLVIITLILSGLFSGIEIAFISSNRLKIELDKSKGLFAAKIISRFSQSPSKFIGALLLGNNISLVIYGIAMANILKPWLINVMPIALSSEMTVLFVQTILATILILFTAELLPKVLFRIKPNAVLNFFAVPMQIFYFIFYPVVFVFIGFAELTLKHLFRLKFSVKQYSFGPVDLGDYVKEMSIDYIDDNEIQHDIHIFQNAIDFRNAKLRECMIPRNEIIAMEDNDPIKSLVEKFIDTGHSKILIYKDSIDNIIGYTHSYDMFHKPASIKDILKPIIIVPETMLANKVLSMMIKEHKSVALVVDEFGGTSGMITMEDIMEEIFGEIEDEHDFEDFTEKKINDKEFIFSGRLEIDYLNDKYELTIPKSDEYETLAGFIIHSHESIPDINDEIHIHPFKFKIIEASENRIKLVQISILDAF